MEDAFKAWRAKESPETTKSLLDATQAVRDKAVKMYGGAPDPVLNSQAKLLAIKALRGFDPKRGVSMQNYLLTQLQPLRRTAALRRSPIRFPEAVQQDAAELHSVSQELRDQLGREPTEVELADKAMIPLKRIQYLRKYKARPVAESSLRDAETGEDLQAATQKRGLMDEVADAVYHDLTPIDKKIMEWRTGYNGLEQLSNNDIARKLGITPGAVTQRASAIASRIEGMMNGRG